MKTAVPGWRPIWCAGVFVFLVALLTVPGRATFGAQTSGDEPQYLLSALSLGQDADLDIADELDGLDWLAFHESPLPAQTQPDAQGQQLSPHNAALPAYLLLPVMLGGWVGAKVSLALLSAALAMMMTWTAIRRFGVPPKPAAGVVAVFACAPPLSIYATQIYPELPAALVVAIAIAALTGTPRWSTALITTLAILLLPWLAVKYIPVAAVLTLALVIRLRGHRRELITSLLVLVAAGAAYLAFHLGVYGGWTPYATGDHFVGGEFTATGDVNVMTRSQRLIGLWVDRAFGVVPWQPAYLLVMVAIGALLRHRPKGWQLLLGVGVAGWFTATFVALTMHGWWWPGRQVVVVVPALVLAVAWWVGPSVRRLWLVLVPGLFGVIATLVLSFETTFGTVRWIVNFHETSNLAYQALSQVLPDYNTVTWWTWILHAAWLLILFGLGYVGYRSSDPQLNTVPVAALPLEHGSDGRDPHRIGIGSSGGS